MGVIFFIVNAVFSLVILLMTIWATAWAVVSKNPDTRYKPMTDDRGSFIKSQTNLATAELDALGATARGDSRLALPMHKRMDLGDDDENSYSSGSNVPSSVGAPSHPGPAVLRPRPCVQRLTPAEPDRPGRAHARWPPAHEPERLPFAPGLQEPEPEKHFATGDGAGNGAGDVGGGGCGTARV